MRICGCFVSVFRLKLRHQQSNLVMLPLTASTPLRPVQPHRLDRAASQKEASECLTAVALLAGPFIISLIALDVAHAFALLQLLPLIGVFSLVTLIALVASIPSIKLRVRNYRAYVRSLRSLAEISAINAASACITLRTSTRAAMAARIKRTTRAAASRRLLSLSHRARLSVALSMLVYLSSIISTRAQTSTLRAAAALAAASFV